MESVAIGTLNAITIIVYLKEYGLRKRSMYLVINLACVDMLLLAVRSLSVGLWEGIANFGRSTL